MVFRDLVLIHKAKKVKAFIYIYIYILGGFCLIYREGHIPKIIFPFFLSGRTLEAVITLPL